MPIRVRAAVVAALVLIVSLSGLAPADTAVAAPAAPQSSQLAQVSGSGANGVDAGAFSTCAIRTNRSLQCWGGNDYGQSIPPSGSFYRVASAWEVSCGIRDDGDTNDGGPLACWGSGAPTVSAADDFIELDVGGFNVCARHADWTVECFGGMTAPANKMTAISVGSNHACGLLTPTDSALSGNNIMCWGWDGLYHVVTAPPTGLFDHVAAYSNYSCAVSATDDSISCWGEQLTSNLNAPAGAFFDLGLGQYGGCGISSPNRTLVCWGTGPAAVAGAYLSVDGGFGHYCGQRGDTGGIECWGDNDKGQVQPRVNSTMTVDTGVAVDADLPITTVSPLPTITVTGTLPSGLSRTGIRITGTSNAPETQTLELDATSGSVMPFDLSVTIAVQWGPVTTLELVLDDPTPTQGQTVGYTVYGLDPGGNRAVNATATSYIETHTAGDSAATGTLTFADFDPASGVTAAATHSITLKSNFYTSLTFSPSDIIVQPLIDAIDLSVDPTSAPVNGTVEATVDGLDENGTVVADLSAYATLASDNADDAVSGTTITLSSAVGSRSITASYGTLDDSVSVSATPGALASLVLTPSSNIADEDDTVTLAVEGFDADGNTLGDLSGSVTITSSRAGDTVAGSAVTFAFTPSAAATTAVGHVLTATSGSVHGSTTVTVAPRVTQLTFAISATTALVGDSVTVTVRGLDASGDLVVDLSGNIVVTSDQGDTVSGNTVTFVHASPHRITATYGTLSDSAVVEVSPRPGRLANSGGLYELTLLLALMILVGGAATALVGRYTARRWQNAD